VLLADLGADVIKVEPLTGDPHRNRGAVVPDEGKRFQSLNRGKRSISVDLARPQGRELIYRMLPALDVATINFRYGVSERLGVDYETLRGHNPALIYCEILGFGNRGPMRDRAATDVVASAYSGLTFADMKTDAEGLPVQVTAISLADYVAGFSAALGVSAALRHRDLTGEGQRVDTSLLAAALSVQDTVVMREPVHDAIQRDPMMSAIEEARSGGASYAELLGTFGAGRRAARSSFRCYYRTYQASDGFLVIGALTEAGRDGVRRALDVTDDHSDEPGFDASDPANVEYSDRLVERIERIMRTRTVAEWLDALAAEGVPAGPIHVPQEMSDDPQVEALGLMSELEHPSTGSQRVVGSPIEMSATPTGVSGPSPQLGQHTSDVLREFADADDAEIEDLLAGGVIRLPV
jgi:crotonobetainyl-CoA:carnitine CoA-transferase CaiB-like acyl-CoA transferase